MQRAGSCQYIIVSLKFRLEALQYIKKMSKDAIMFAIDTGNSMDQNFSENATRLKIAMECFKLTLQQKIFNNSTHEVGLSLFGDNETQDGDENNCLLHDIAKPDLQFVRKVALLGDSSKLKNNKAGGDIFNAIQFIINRISEHCQKKKYNKRAFIFTNGMGDTNCNMNGLDRIVKMLRENEIKLNIIALDFMENYDVQENTLDEEIGMEPNQLKNATLLMKLRSLQMDNVQIFPGSLAIQLYKKFRKRDVNPVALFKGNFEIGPGLAIQVSTYKGIRKEKLKSLQKYDTTTQWNPNITDTKQIVNDVSYTVEGDETGTVVDKENMINAYPYGPNLIPVSSLMEAGSKLFEEKNFRLLGFVDKAKIPRHCLMGQADIVIPSDNPLSRKLFSAFIYSMISLNRYAIARYVPRNNKNGVTPKLVVLMPYRTPERELFYLIELPTAEDIREYPFNGLKQANERQREIVKQLVQKMSLYRNVDGEQQEQVRIENTFNPVHQYFYQTVFYRAISNEEKIPDLDPVIKRYITPQQKKYQETQQLMKTFKKQFKLNKKDINKGKEKKSAVIWRDILTADEKPGDTLSMADTELEQPVYVGKKFNFQQDDDTEHIDPNLPIPTFRKMLTNNKRDLVSVALHQMTELIKAKAERAVKKQDIKQIIQLSSVLRFGCIEQRQTNFWDQWLERCPTEIGQETYSKIISEGLGYINKSNQGMYKPQDELHALMEEPLDELD